MPAFVPKRLEAVAFALLLSSMMSLMVSGLSTALAVGVHAGFVLIWLKSVAAILVSCIPDGTFCRAGGAAPASPNCHQRLTPRRFMPRYPCAS